MVSVSTEDFLWFVDECLDAMVAIVRELGDDRANRAPDVPGVNTPYAILTHCLGVMEHWGGHVVAGRATTRDRDAEFRAAGSVDELAARAAGARRRLAEDGAGADSTAPPRGAARPDGVDLPIARTQGGALVHVFHELAQHLGQMELTRDLLL